MPGALTHCSRRLDEDTFEALAEAFPDGMNTPGLTKNLTDGLYNPVVCAIWGEQNIEKKVEWLRSHAMMHAPLMLEQAIEEFENCPTVQTIVRISIPLIHAATFRIHQDASCLRGYSRQLVPLADMVYKTYTEALVVKMSEKRPCLDLEKILLDKSREIKRFTQEYLSIIAERTIRAPDTLPTPVWISYNLEGKQWPMVPAEKYNSIRQQIVENNLLGWKS